MNMLLYNYDILSMIIMVHLIYFPIIINEPSLLVVLFLYFFPYFGHNLSHPGRDDNGSFFVRLVRDLRGEKFWCRAFLEAPGLRVRVTGQAGRVHQDSTAAQ